MKPIKAWAVVAKSKAKFSPLLTNLSSQFLVFETRKDALANIELESERVIPVMIVPVEKKK